ncbi:hypothetical protein BGZ49_002733, partial [Haplosporangium sp. Z 27]
MSSTSATSKTSARDQQTTWALSDNGGDEHVSIRTFTEKFNYSDRETAEEDYSRLINSSEISKSRRAQLQKDFEKFIKNKVGAEAYWVRRTTAIETAIATMNASVESMRAGHRQSKMEYKRHFMSEEAQPFNVEITQEATS